MTFYKLLRSAGHRNLYLRRQYSRTPNSDQTHVKEGRRIIIMILRKNTNEKAMREERGSSERLFFLGHTDRLGRNRGKFSGNAFFAECSASLNKKDQERKMSELDSRFRLKLRSGAGTGTDFRKLML